MSDFNPKAIKKFGGGKIYALPIADPVAGAKASDDSDGSNWVPFGYVESSTLNDNTEIEDIKDETGSVVDSDEVERVVKFTGVLMQSDKETLDFFRNTVREKYYMVYRDAGEVDGQQQEHIFGICTIKPMIEVETGRKRIPFEITVLKNASAIAYGGTDVALPTVATVTSGTIPAGEYYSIEEN